MLPNDFLKKDAIWLLKSNFVCRMEFLKATKEKSRLYVEFIKILFITLPGKPTPGEGNFIQGVATQYDYPYIE